MNTYVRVKVTEENIDQLTELVIRGTPSEKRSITHNWSLGDIVKQRYPGAMWIEPYGLKEVRRWKLDDISLNNGRWGHRGRMVRAQEDHT